MRSDRGTASLTGDGCGVPRHGEGAVVSTPITAAERYKRMPARGHAASLVLGAARIEAEEADDWRESSRADDYRAQALATLSDEMIAMAAAASGPRGIAAKVPPNGGSSTQSRTRTTSRRTRAVGASISRNRR